MQSYFTKINTYHHANKQHLEFHNENIIVKRSIQCIPEWFRNLSRISTKFCIVIVSSRPLHKLHKYKMQNLIGLTDQPEGDFGPSLKIQEGM